MTEKLSNDPINKTATFRLAQTDMCKDYANGSIGIIVSGLIWLILQLCRINILLNKLSGHF